MAAAEGDFRLGGQAHLLHRGVVIHADGLGLGGLGLIDVGGTQGDGAGGGISAGAAGEQNDLGDGRAGTRLPLQPEGQQGAQLSGIEGTHTLIQGAQADPLLVGGLDLHFGVADGVGGLQDGNAGQIGVVRDQILQVAVLAFYHTGGKEGGDVAVHGLLKIAFRLAGKRAQSSALLQVLVDLQLIELDPTLVGLGNLQFDVTGGNTAAVTGVIAVGRVHIRLIVKGADGSPGALRIGIAANADIQIVGIVRPALGEPQGHIVHRLLGAQIKDHILALGLLGPGPGKGGTVAVRHLLPDIVLIDAHIAGHKGQLRFQFRGGGRNGGDGTDVGGSRAVVKSDVAHDGQVRRRAVGPHGSIGGILEGQTLRQGPGQGDLADAHDLRQAKAHIVPLLQRHITADIQGIDAAILGRLHGAGIFQAGVDHGALRPVGGHREFTDVGPVVRLAAIAGLHQTQAHIAGGNIQILHQDVVGVDLLHQGHPGLPVHRAFQRGLVQVIVIGIALALQDIDGADGLDLAQVHAHIVALLLDNGVRSCRTGISVEHSGGVIAVLLLLAAQDGIEAGSASQAAVRAQQRQHLVPHSRDQLIGKGLEPSAAGLGHDSGILGRGIVVPLVQAQAGIGQIGPGGVHVALLHRQDGQQRLLVGGDDGSQGLQPGLQLSHQGRIGAVGPEILHRAQNMGKLLQQALELPVIGGQRTGQSLLLDGIQGVRQIFRLREALVDPAGIRAVGYVAGNGQVGVVHLGLEVLEAVLPKLLHVIGVVVPVPAPADQLEVGHLVGLGIIDRVGDNAHLAAQSVSRGHIVADIAQVNAGLVVLGAGVVEPGGGIVAGLLIGPVDVVLGDGGVDVGAGPIDVDVLIQTPQGVQLGAVPGPAHIIPLGAIQDGTAVALLLLLQPRVHGVEQGHHIGVGAAVVVVVEDVEITHAHIIHLLELGLQLFHILQILCVLLAGSGVAAGAAEESALADVNGPGVVHLGLFGHVGQVLDLGQLLIGIQIIPPLGVVGIGLGGKHIEIALHVPDGAHLALPAFIVKAAVEAFNKAPEPYIGVVLNLHRQELLPGKGGKHHLQGGQAVVNTVAVLAHDGDHAVGVFRGIGHQHIGVVLPLSRTVGIFKQIGAGSGRGIGNGGVPIAVDPQQNIGLALNHPIGGGHGHAIAGQDLLQKGGGIGVDPRLCHHVDLCGHGEGLCSLRIDHRVGYGIDLIAVGVLRKAVYKAVLHRAFRRGLQCKGRRKGGGQHGTGQQ